jgi:hypothetical protein
MHPLQQQNPNMLTTYFYLPGCTALILPHTCCNCSFDGAGRLHAHEDGIEVGFDMSDRVVGQSCCSHNEVHGGTYVVEDVLRLFCGGLRV